MNTLLIIFDSSSLTQQVQESVVGFIKLQGAWARLSPGAWLVRTAKTSAALRDELGAYSSGNRIIVFNVTGDGWGTSFSDEVSNWMKENI